MTNYTETIKATIIRQPVATTRQGQRDLQGRRWIGDVLARMEQMGLKHSDLWALHMQGSITLSRCDLPQCFPTDKVSESELNIGTIGQFHFVKLGR